MLNNNNNNNNNNNTDKLNYFANCFWNIELDTVDEMLEVVKKRNEIEAKRKELISKYTKMLKEAEATKDAITDPEMFRRREYTIKSLREHIENINNKKTVAEMTEKELKKEEKEYEQHEVKELAKEQMLGMSEEELLNSVELVPDAQIAYSEEREAQIAMINEQSAKITEKLGLPEIVGGRGERDRAWATTLRLRVIKAIYHKIDRIEKYKEEFARDLSYSFQQNMYNDGNIEICFRRFMYVIKKETDASFFTAVAYTTLNSFTTFTKDVNLILSNARLISRNNEFVELDKRFIKDMIDRKNNKEKSLKADKADTMSDAIESSSLNVSEEDTENSTHMSDDEKQVENDAVVIEDAVVVEEVEEEEIDFELDNNISFSDIKERIRQKEIDGVKYYSSTDFLVELDYSKSSAGSVVKRHVSIKNIKRKVQSYTRNGSRKTRITMINEAGLYELVMKSKKEKAKYLIEEVKELSETNLIEQIADSEAVDVISSKDVAARLNLSHSNVCRVLEDISGDTDDVIKSGPGYLLNKNGFTLFMLNISGHNDMKMRYIKRMNEMQKTCVSERDRALLALFE